MSYAHTPLRHYSKSGAVLLSMGLLAVGTHLLDHENGAQRRDRTFVAAAQSCLRQEKWPGTPQILTKTIAPHLTKDPDMRDDAVMITNGPSQFGRAPSFERFFPDSNRVVTIIGDKSVEVPVTTWSPLTRALMNVARSCVAAARNAPAPT